MRQQQLDYLRVGMVARHSEDQRRDFANVQGINIGARLEERFDGLRVALRGGTVQRSHTADSDRTVLHDLGGFAGLHIDLRAVFEQQLHHRGTADAVAGGIDQRCIAAFIDGIDFGLTGDQHAGDFEVVGSGGLREYAAATLVARVDIRAFVDQQARYLGRPVDGGGDRERGVSQIRAGVNVSAFGKEQPHLRRVACTPHQGRCREVVGDVRVGAGIEQQTHTLQAP